MTESTSATPPDRPGRLAGRRVLITGASRGIGQAIALRYAEEGARLKRRDLPMSQPPHTHREQQAIALGIKIKDIAVRSGCGLEKGCPTGRARGAAVMERACSRMGRVNLKLTPTAGDRIMISRRPFLTGLGLLPALAIRPAWAQGPNALRSIAVMDVELVDDHLNPDTVVDQERRLRDARSQLQQVLASRGLYRVLDPAPAQTLLTQLHEQQAFLYRCDDCIVQVGVLLGADLVMSSWVQKVSELILNFNVQVHNTAQQKLVLTKSVDMRGNNDVSWTRAIDYLVRAMAERRAENPAYGT